MNMKNTVLHSKQVRLIFICSLSILILNGCVAGQIQTADRPEFGDDSKVEYSREKINANGETETETKLTEKDLEKYAYELGMNPKKTLSKTEMGEVRNRRRLRQLERTLDSEKERLSYSKVLPLFLSDLEKIEYLSIPSIEGRQSWVNRNKVWSRMKSNKDFQDMVESQDLTLGMTQDLVRKSWGDPDSVENSGNPIYKNERWKYTRESPSLNGYKRERRYVYFEGGRVVGWETE